MITSAIQRGHTAEASAAAAPVGAARPSSSKEGVVTSASR